MCVTHHVPAVLFFMVSWVEEQLDCFTSLEPVSQLIMCHMTIDRPLENQKEVWEIDCGGSVASIVQGGAGSVGESCWSTAEFSLGPQTARNKVGTN